MIAVGQIRMGVPRPDAEENDRSVRKNDDRSMRRPTSEQVRAMPGENKDRSLHRGEDGSEFSAAQHLPVAGPFG
jgi:hypothetical protein